MSAELNPFEAPKAESTARDEEGFLERPFVAISIPKLVVLTIFSFGLYHLVWFYRNFRRTHGVGGSVLYTLFAGFTCFELFRSMEMFALEQDVTPKFRSTFMGALVLGIGIASWLVPDPLSLLAPFVSVIPLAIVQSTVNEALVKQQPDGDRDDRFGGGTIAVILIGSIFWLLTFVGVIFQLLGFTGAE